MKYKAEINVMPLNELLDPQGKAVMNGLSNMGFQGITNVRIGKRILIELEAENEKITNSIIDDACKKLLANMIVESYEFKVYSFVDI